MLKSSVKHKQIADVTKTLEKRPIEISNKCLDAEDSDDESNDKSDNEHKSTKDHSLGSMSIE